jgi:hypothetical protein
MPGTSRTASAQPAGTTETRGYCTRRLFRPFPFFSLTAVVADSVFILSQVQHLVAASAAAIDTDNARAVPVFISGATGVFASDINGLFNPMKEHVKIRRGLDGRLVYLNKACILEHFEGRWIVRPMDRRGTAAGLACVEGGCALEACTSRPWKMWDGKEWIDAPDLKMAIGAEAKQKVSGCSLRLHSVSSPCFCRSFAVTFLGAGR